MGTIIRYTNEAWVEWHASVMSGTRRLSVFDLVGAMPGHGIGYRISNCNKQLREDGRFLIKQNIFDS